MGISGGGGAQNEGLIFTFDVPTAAASILIDLRDIEFGSGPGDKDDPVIFISAAGIVYTILEAEIEGAFTSTGNKEGRVDFSQFNSLPLLLLIDSFKLRETEGHIAVLKIVNAGQATGACCFDDGSCEVILESSCVALGGNFLGDGTSCDDCPALTGACCFLDDPCQESLSEATCTTRGGNFIGAGTTCTDCPPVITGACCFDGNVCQESFSEATCAAQGGTYLVDGTDCTQQCPSPITGACCLPSGCVENVSGADCAAQGGIFIGAGTGCTQTCPPITTGACCFADEPCQEPLSEATCTTRGGNFIGAGTTCTDCPPVITGACCFADSCQESLSEVTCNARGGNFIGDGSICTQCPVIIDCNNNGTADDVDIANGTSQVCNSNGIPDECDLDSDGDGIPDDCEPPPCDDQNEVSVLFSLLAHAPVCGMGCPSMLALSICGLMVLKTGRRRRTRRSGTTGFRRAVRP